MHIGGATSYPAPAATPLPARPVASSVSPDVSLDIARASQPPLTSAQPLADEQSASSREEADQPAESPSSTAQKDAKGEPSPQQQRLEQLEIAKLVSRDQEVRAHEQAHAAVGGRYAGAPSYTYDRGPDGKRYAVGGEVSIDTGPVPGDPEATLRKMEVVLRAALAPAEPSAQDRQIAAQAQALMSEARAELAQQQRAEADAAHEARAQEEEEEKAKEQAKDSAEEDRRAEPVQQDLPPPPSLDLYRQLSGLQAPASVVDLVT
ncbi:putative metalloprotease CJM1_0395 family protein [Pseudomonas sp.]|uniref:putative metalloprotease CJM1_0395 family protein n=1 Tax=Pseudomonas sp. TaxID=306 RepID=UPI003C789232